MSFSTFIADQSAVRDRGDWLIELYPLNESGVETLLQFSRRGTATDSSIVTVGSDTIGAHKIFRKRLLKAPTMTQSLWSPGQILSSSLPSFGSGVFNNADGGFDEYRNWDFSGRKFKMFFCDSSDVQNGIKKIGDGIMGDPKYDLSRFEIPFLGRESLFDTPLSTKVYRGTGPMLELSGSRTITFGAAPAAVGLVGNMTIEGWLWIDTSPNANVTHWGWTVAAGNRPWWMVITGGRNLILAAYVGGAVQFVTTVAAMAIKKFYQFAVVVSGVSVTFYIWDDDLQTETIETFPNAFTSTPRDAIGGTAAYTLSSANVAVLWHDEFRVFNYARTATEIRADRFRTYNTSSLPAGLVHYVKFDDAVGTTVIDSSTTGANGTITGGGTSTWLHSQEGGSELAGTPKPFCNGEKFGAAPVLVDGVRQGYQVASESINNVTSYEGGLSHTMDATAASFRAYLTTTPAAGHSLRYLARGLFKLGSSPSLPISALVEGFNGGALGYVNKGGTIVRDIITRRGPKLVDPTDLDTAAFTAYASNTPAIIGLYYKSPGSKEVKVKNALDMILKSGGGWYGYVGSSTLFYLEKFVGPAALSGYNFKANQVIKGSLSPIKIESVIWKVIVRYRKNDVVLSEDQVAGAVKGTTNWQQWTMEWQEAEDHDDALLERYPGAASDFLIVDTLLQYEFDAKTLASYLLDILKGKKRGWQVSIGATGLETLMGESASLIVSHQDDIIRLGLDGITKYAILTVTYNQQEGQVNLQIWGPAT